MNFLKTFAASLLAVIVGSVLSGVLMMFLLGGMMAASLGSGAKNMAFVTDGTVLSINVNQPIVDAPDVFGFPFMAMSGTEPSIKLIDMIDAIDRAAYDERIEGIYLYENGLPMTSSAHQEEVRTALVRFKDSGKWIVARSDVFSQSGYWLASVADKVFVNPAGTLEWKGVAAQVFFFKGLADKLGVDMQILRHGTFKSAVEPFMMDKMSEANREQTEKYVGSLWAVMLEQISESRGIETFDLQRYADQLAIVFPEDAVKYGLADGLMYSDQLNNYISALVDGTTEIDAESEVEYDAFEEGAPNYVSMVDYLYNKAGATKRYSKNRIGVIYINGEIMDGESARGTVGNVTVAQQLRQAGKDDGVKAVVVRVNSPGGSALASEAIWREIEVLKAKKPVIVSMGEYAASGGYYVACGADAIITDRTTLTGSIGVFGMLPNVQKAMRDKLGITIDEVKTARYADIGSPFRAMESAEKEYLLKNVERVYDTFVGRVAEGRNMPRDGVDAIGEGRVWLGEDALEIGLVDGFGGLKDAIVLAADRAGISEDYRVVEISGMMPELPLMMKMLFSTKIKVEVLGEELENVLAEYSAIKGLLKTKGVQARLPFVIVSN